MTSTSVALGDASAFERRARTIWRLRLACATLAVAATVAFLLVAFRQPATTTSLLPASSSGVVVLDVSASISTDTYARIAATLDRLVRSNGCVRPDPVLRHGLPDPAAEHPCARTRAAAALFRAQVGDRARRAAANAPRSPWTDSFAGGTRISTGLSLALDVIRDRSSLGRPCCSSATSTTTVATSTASARSRSPTGAQGSRFTSWA